MIYRASDPKMVSTAYKAGADFAAHGNCVQLLQRGPDERENKTQFLKKITPLIERRGAFMAQMLRLTKALGMDAYKELRNRVFMKDDAVYGGYEDVLPAVKEHLKGHRIR